MYFDPNPVGNQSRSDTFYPVYRMYARRFDNFDSSFHVTPSCSKREFQVQLASVECPKKQGL